MGVPTEDGSTRFPGLREVAERRRRVLDDLVSARRDRGLSQTEVAARMSTSQSVISRLEAGGVDVRLSTLERYAAAVGHRLEVRLHQPEGDSHA